MLTIAEAIGRELGLPAAAVVAEYFGFAGRAFRPGPAVIERGAPQAIRLGAGAPEPA